MVPIVLDHNLRNTRQIGDVFNTLTPMRMRLLGRRRACCDPRRLPVR